MAQFSIDLVEERWRLNRWILSRGIALLSVLLWFYLLTELQSISSTALQLIILSYPIWGTVVTKHWFNKLNNLQGSDSSDNESSSLRVEHEDSMLNLWPLPGLGFGISTSVPTFISATKFRDRYGDLNKNLRFQSFEKFEEVFYCFMKAIKSGELERYLVQVERNTCLMPCQELEDFGVYLHQEGLYKESLESLILIIKRDYPEYLTGYFVQDIHRISVGMCRRFVYYLGITKHRTLYTVRPECGGLTHDLRRTDELRDYVLRMIVDYLKGYYKVRLDFDYSYKCLITKLPRFDKSILYIEINGVCIFFLTDPLGEFQIKEGDFKIDFDLIEEL